MAGGALTLYNSAKLILGEKLIDLRAAGEYRAVLLSSDYTPSLSHSTWANLSAYEHATAYGYTASGYELTNDWSASGNGARFDSDDPHWTATGSALTAHYVAVVHCAAGTGQALVSGDKIIGYALLDTAGGGTDVSADPGNILTVQVPATGWFGLGVA